MSEASAVSVRSVGDVAVVTMDDGKANAISHAILDDLNAALDDVAANSAVLVLMGRPGKFSAGFDLSVMNQGGNAVPELVKRGAELCVRLFQFPRPVVAASTGHALAAGAIMLMSCDDRTGVEGNFKIGMNEVSIGMVLPKFACDLAQERLSKRHFTHATQCATVYSPTDAVDVGYLDRTCSEDELEAVVLSLIHI